MIVHLPLAVRCPLYLCCVSAVYSLPLLIVLLVVHYLFPIPVLLGSSFDLIKTISFHPLCLPMEQDVPNVVRETFSVLIKCVAQMIAQTKKNGAHKETRHYVSNKRIKKRVDEMSRLVRLRSTHVKFPPVGRIYACSSSFLLDKLLPFISSDGSPVPPLSLIHRSKSTFGTRQKHPPLCLEQSLVVRLRWSYPSGS